jgi:hypothetical protein
MSKRAASRCLYGLLLLFLTSSGALAQYSEGACGGAMRGYDGRGYPCEADRKPVCETSTGRCVCLQKKECGSKRDQQWFDQD